jgi:hypothetical protein
MEQPEVRGPLKWQGRVYGHITIHPNGDFSGEITDPEIHANMVSFIRNGFTDGIILTCRLVPGIPQPKENN